MNSVEAKKRIEKLRKVINHHRYLYHVLDKQGIFDEAFDQLKHELKQLEDKYPEFVTPDSPTQRIGGKPLEKFEKVRHKVKQWSLEDAFSEAEIKKWANRLERFLDYKEENIDFIGELKIDGLHIVLTYEKGVLKTGATRGDGEVGEDVTQNLKTIDAIPLRLAKDVDIVVEGEAFMRKSVFEELNEEFKKEGKHLLANPRNAAAGAIRQLDPRIAASRRLDAFIYEFSWPEEAIPPTQKKELELLSALGFKVNNRWQYLKTIDEVAAFWKKWEKKRDSEDYWIDGVVIKVNFLELQKKLGWTGKAPRFALAAKFSPEEKTTIIKKIVSSVGRTGKITPVAFLEPVEIKGTRISRATLHNYDEIKRLDAREGDTVIVRKAGDVIPQVAGVIKDLRKKGAKSVTSPTKCPICGKILVKKKGDVDVFCKNSSCRVTCAKRLIYFASKAGLDIKGLGEKVIERFIDEGFFINIVSIFDLKKEDIQELEGFGEKSAQNLLDAIENAKNMELRRFINALGVDYVGFQTSGLIVNWLEKKFGAIRNPKKLLKIWAPLTSEDLQSIKGIGPKASQSFTAFIRKKQNHRMLEELAKRGMKFKGQAARGTLDGKIFLFTGELESMSRGEAQKKVIEAGGEAATSISKRVDYIVVGENPGSKFEKAKNSGIKTISEEEFLKILRSSTS